MGRRKNRAARGQRGLGVRRARPIQRRAEPCGDAGGFAEQVAALDRLSELSGEELERLNPPVRWPQDWRVCVVCGEEIHVEWMADDIDGKSARCWDCV